ncbi:MAG TPA: PKD domain-containing protein, partial [Candidatus Dormibacteraeota bacterium]|nr:PKD domain-containing protein [Candidatus Dormibacteraeota bacterium]
MFKASVGQRNPEPIVSTVSATSTFSYLVVITMMNASLGNIIGNPLAPYLNYLANTWGLANDYTSLFPHRVANYIAMTSGNTTVSTDCVPFNSTKATCPLSNTNIIDRIEGAGFTWTAWAEDYPVTRGCTTDTTSAGYDVKSFPFLYYTDITGNTARCNSLRRANTAIVSSGYETDDLFLNSLSSTSTATNYNWLSPNSCDSMHSCIPLSTVATADNYISNLVPAILSSNIFQTQKAALFLTFAEGVQKTVSTTDYVPTIWAGPVAKTGYQSSSQYDHYSMLKTIETSWGLTSITSNDGNAATMNEFLNAQLGVALSASPNPTEVGAQVKLNALASGGTSPYTSFNWSFGDGSTSTTTSASTTHTYATSGSFTATVTVTDSVGSMATSSFTTMTVNPKLTVIAGASPKSTDTGMPVSFTATISGGVSTVQCSWSFGDGSTGNGCSTSHSYTTSGTLTATVDATDSIGVAASSSVSVTVYSQLTAMLSASANPTEVGSQVTLTASATGGTGTYSSYAWTFGDGASATTTTASTTHTYTSAGSLSVKVKITDSAGSTATSSALSITVSSKLTASASASSAQTDVGITENFDAATSGGVGSPNCNWSFGDGSTDNVCSTSHTYSSAGTFTATVTVTDALGVTATSSIVVIINDTPVVDFGSTPTSAFTGHSVNFTATITGGTGPFTFGWDFGDGKVGQGNPTSHTYTVDGTFTVTLTITDSAGSTSTQSHSLTVTLNFGVSNISISPSPSEVGVKVAFSAQTVAGTSPYTCSWSFGDGTTATGCSTTHVYSVAGNFTVTVNAADSTGKTASASQQILANPTIIATASASPNPTDAGFSTRMTVNVSGGVGPVSCTWTFGDGSSATGCSTTHIYSSSGSFTANVTVTDSLGLNASGIVGMVVNPPLNPTSPSASPNPTEVGTQVSFALLVSGGTIPYTSYSWSFGDATTVTTSSATATHTYTSPGTFTVSVTVTDSAGSKATSSNAITINPKLGVTAKANPDPTEVGKSASFTGTVSGGVGLPSCNWSFGDGSIATGCSTSHTYTSTGTFIASVTSVDGLGVTSTGNLTISVNARLTTSAIASPNPIDASVPVLFNSTMSGGLSPTTCSWVFGDSSFGTGCSTTHGYAAAGTFTAVVTATDSLGIVATANVSVTVHPKLVVTVSVSPSFTEVGKLTGFTGATLG